MKKGERNLVTMQASYGFGAAEHKGPLAVVPPGAAITYNVELVEHENVSVWLKLGGGWRWLRV